MSSFVLVGDLQQSIYGFQGARPDLVESASDDMGLRRIALRENHRSSQRLCDAAFRIAGRTEADVAVGPFKDTAFSPEVVLYDPAEAAAIRSAFYSYMQQLEVSPDRAIVVARTTDFVETLNGDDGFQGIDGRVKKLLAVRRKRTVQKADLRYIRELIRLCAFGDEGNESSSDVRERALEILLEVRADSQDLFDWVVRVGNALKAVVSSINPNPTINPRQLIPGREGYRGILVDQPVPAKVLPLARTVHGVKGESCSGILLVDQPHGRQREPRQAALWAEHVEGGGDFLDEERRILYVALTRAEQYAGIALPVGCPAESLAAFERAGFSIVQSLSDWVSGADRVESDARA